MPEVNAIVYGDFLSFMRRIVLPRREANPNHIRLDGARTGGTWEKVGDFERNGIIWEVFADSHYEPLMLAYSAAVAGADPSAEEYTARGLSLALTPDLRARQRSRHKYLYIYSWSAARARKVSSGVATLPQSIKKGSNIRMSDPLVGFDWTHILGRYDALCSRFDPHSGHVTALRPLPSNDRLLYYHLIEAARPSVSGVRPLLDIRWYEALLYWKLYSQPYIKNISAWLPRDATSRSRDSEQLRHLLARMPTNIPQELSAIVSLLKTLDSYSLGGMKTVSAFPVRSTFLHILYPKVVPIFDKMVLQSVGIEDEGTNHNLGVFCQYLPHAWTLARRHAEKFTRYKETPVRLIDMALWIVRNSAGRRRRPVA